MSQGTLNRITNIIREIGAEKTASQKRAMEDPGHMNGESSHPSKMPEGKGNERAATEGEQTADNAAIMKDTIANGVDSTTPVTPSSAPKAGDQQVAPATPTGEDTANERDYKGTKDDVETSHPANGSIGDKYAHVTREWLTSIPDEQLFKLAADLGNEIVAKVAEGHFNPPPAAPARAPAAKTAADTAVAAGYQAAAAAGETDLEKIAADMIYESHAAGVEDGANVAAYLMLRRAKLAEETEDPMGGSAEGEDHGSEGGGESAEGESTSGGGSGGAPPAGGGDAGGAELLAAMGGGGGDMGGAPPADPMAGGGGAGPMPPEAAGMGGDQALQQLAMALLELGIDPAQLAAAAGGAGGGGMPPGGAPPGGDPMAAMMGGGGAPPPAPGGMPPGGESPLPKLAQKVANYKASGKFQVSEAKTAQERKVRDWMKRYVKEVTRR